jgi:hypothetical protein
MWIFHNTTYEQLEGEIGWNFWMKNGTSGWMLMDKKMIMMV